MLLEPVREVSVELELLMDSGEVDTFKAVCLVHSCVRAFVRSCARAFVSSSTTMSSLTRCPRLCYLQYRVQHSDDRGPFKGGLRYHPQVDIVRFSSVLVWLPARHGNVP